jgi:hypothetical protein
VTSFLEAKGVPGIAERTLVRPPKSQLGPILPDQRAAVMAASPVQGKYETVIDRESAFEKLQARSQAAAAEVAQAESGPVLRIDPDEFNRARRFEADAPPRDAAPARRTSRGDSIGTTFAKSLARQVGSAGGRALVRGVLGSLFRSR